MRGQNSKDKALTATASRKSLNERPKVLPYAKRHSIMFLNDLSQKIEDDPKSAVIVSDIHGNINGLKNVLKDLKVVDSNFRRIANKGVLVQIGDLADGRDVNDLACLQYGNEVFDFLLAGNHETAILDGKPFTGLREVPEVKQELKMLARSGRLNAALAINGFLVSHAGFNNNLFDDDNIKNLEAKANDQFVEFFYKTYYQPDSLFAHTAHRGRGGTSAYGGVLWQDFSQLVQPGQHNKNYKQITGHSVLGGVESDESENVFCIDLKGERIGVAVVDSQEKVYFGSDYIYNDEV